MEKDLRVSLLLDFYQNALTKRQADAIDLYYNQDLSLFEISQHLSISRQGVFDLIKRGEAKLLSLDKEFGLLEKLMQRNAALLEVKGAVQRIQAASNQPHLKEFETVYSILDRLIEREE